MIVLAEILVNVNVKPPTETVHEGLNAPTPTLIVVGARVTAEFAAIPKFPVDAPLVPGLARVFAVVDAEMFPAGVRTAWPPFPGVKPTLPEGSIAAYAVLLSNAAINPAAPASFGPNFAMS
jgi:hypothetical protein